MPKEKLREEFMKEFNYIELYEPMEKQVSWWLEKLATLRTQAFWLGYEKGNEIQLSKEHLTPEEIEKLEAKLQDDY